MDSNEKMLSDLRSGVSEPPATLDQANAILAALAEEESKAKRLKRLDAWRLIWGCFMIFIVLPAWFCAGVVEGENFDNAVELVSRMIRGLLHLPDYLAMALVWPITVVAKIIPASSTWPFIAFMVLGAGFVAIPLIVFTIFFGYRLPPYFREMKSKIDPLWEVKENEGVIQRAAIRSGPFSALIVFFVLAGLIGVFFIHPNIRTVIADRWSGKLSVMEASGRKHQLNARIVLNYIDPGYILDLRPGVTQRTLFLEFSGEDLKLLKDIGISDAFFKGAKRDSPYAERGCQIRNGTISRSRKYEFKLIDPGNYAPGATQECPSLVQLYVSDFSNAKLSIKLESDKYHLESDLERDSRWSFIEQFIVDRDFRKNPEVMLERGMGVR